MAQSHILQVVNGDGEFNEDGVQSFIRQHSISDAGVGYQVVAITGPQSSGKSTLMNAVVSMEPIADCSHSLLIRSNSCRWQSNRAKIYSHMMQLLSSSHPALTKTFAPTHLT